MGTGKQLNRYTDNKKLNNNSIIQGKLKRKKIRVDKRKLLHVCNILQNIKTNISKKRKNTKQNDWRFRYTVKSDDKSSVTEKFRVWNISLITSSHSLVLANTSDYKIQF